MRRSAARTGDSRGEHAARTGIVGANTPRVQGIPGANTPHVREFPGCFDFAGQYDEVKTHETITYTLGDGRVVAVYFSADVPGTKVIEQFDAENTNSIEMQRAGWQAILDNFKKYVEAN